MAKHYGRSISLEKLLKQHPKAIRFCKNINGDRNKINTICQQKLSNIILAYQTVIT
jgi:hypothetical protein